MNEALETQNSQTSTGSPLDTAPYRIRAVVLQVELEFFTTDGKVLKTQLTDPLPIYEAEFPAGLMDYLKSKGLTPVA